MTNDRPASRWGQTQLSLWLSRRRLDKLRRIAATLPPGATPLDAIDRALDLATAPIFAPRPGALADETEPAQVAEQIAPMEARLAAIAARSERVLSAKLDRLAVAVDHVLELALASSSSTLAAGSLDFEGQTDESANGDTSEDIGQWLRVRLAVAGATAKEVTVVRATVRSASRYSGPSSATRFDAILSEVDGRAIRDALPPGPIFVSDVEANRALSRLDRGQAVCFLCRPSSDGRWAVDAHIADQAGATGDAIASFRA
ncbi:hypothetical protein [Paraburkholderia flava]|uniref:hypothetical protein n=1 Tax=Paraburkholderia flava TaxID=2547393 RepID=UPI00105D5D64|nr:hypothetical protein [Paraburkholderia flava]